MTHPFERDLERVKKEGLHRVLRRIEGAQGRSVILDGREVLLFCSNNYLGLCNHPGVIRAAKECIDREGWGAGASRLISGTMESHARFEEEAAAFLSKPAALLFNSGYAANVGVLTALMGRGDTIFADRLCHASIIDGARWSGAELKRFQHNDPDDLERLMSATRSTGKRLIVTDGVFSMDGDIAPLSELAGAAERRGAMFMVDDAHGFGVFGPRGRGTVHGAGVEERVDIHVATLGKALGGSGGFVAGSRPLIDGLINFSRSFIFSTAPPPAVAAAGSASLTIVAGPEGDRRRAALHESASKFASNLKRLGYNIGDSRSQIVPVFLDAEVRAERVVDHFLNAGVYAPLIRPPAVPKGTERIRLSVTADHTGEDIRKATGAFAELRAALR